MSDTEEFDQGLENLSAAADGTIAGSITASALGPLAQRQESIAQMLTEDANLTKLTNLFSREEPRLYAKMNYLIAFTRAVGEIDTKGGFRFPDFQAHLMMPDYQLRTSVKQQTRKILESITKIFERGAGERHALFSRRG